MKQKIMAQFNLKKKKLFKKTKFKGMGTKGDFMKMRENHK